MLKNLVGFAMKNLAGFGLKNLAGLVSRRKPAPIAKLLEKRSYPKRNRDTRERFRHLTRLKRRLRKLTRSFGMDHPLTQHTDEQCKLLELRISMGD